MIKRNHPLSVGEVVFDCNKECFGIVTELNKTEKTAKLAMNKDFEHNFDTEKENLLMFDEEIPEEEKEWEAHTISLYQVVWDKVDARERNPICYEHICKDYPFYSPYLDENLFEFETMEK